jgi:peptidyl-prolyl cis-trans isomerase C
MRLSLSALAIAAVLAAPAALAQTPPPAAPAAAPKNADPVVAIVGKYDVHMSDLQADLQSIPAQAQQLPPAQLYQMLLSQEVDRKAVLAAALKEGLQKDPTVAKQMQDAASVKLENAYVQKKVLGQVTDAAVLAEYNKDYANKPGAEQVQARQILVQTQQQAQDIITQLNQGADFATLAQKDSIDPGAKNGGELGWFAQTEMVPAFASAAFALKPGEYTKTPVQTQFGFHVILCEGKRTAPTPKLADVQAQIKQQLGDAAVQTTLDAVRSDVKIQLFNPDGSPAAAAPAAAPATP